MPPKKSAARKPKVDKSLKTMPIMNNLSGAIMGPGFGFGDGCGNQLSQVATLFKNERWYLISNMRQILSEMYAEHGLVQTVVDVPVDDGLRGGIEIKTKQLNEEEIDDLLVDMDHEERNANSWAGTQVEQAFRWIWHYRDD